VVASLEDDGNAWTYFLFVFAMLSGGVCCSKEENDSDTGGGNGNSVNSQPQRDDGCDATPRRNAKASPGESIEADGGQEQKETQVRLVRI
jgi:hypothetical protein